MAIRTITLTIELDDTEQAYSVALDLIESCEVKLRSVYRQFADIRVMEFSREAKP